MKIVCDNCSAKYQISDDKVRNKTFKIRCKKCSHVIVVRGGQPDAEEPAPAEAEAPAAAAAEPAMAAAAAPAADPDAVWHVVINRENVGPLTTAQVEGYFHSGDIDIESFTWAEGMTDWSRLGSVPQFAHLAPAPAPAAVAAAPVAAHAAADADPTHQAPAGMFPSEDDDVIASNNVADTPAAAPAGGGGMFPADEPADPRVSTAAQLRNQRNENSVLFSLDSLAADVESKKRTKVSNTGGSEASGLIDISALSSLDGPGRGDDPFGGGVAMAPAPLTGAAAVQPLVAPSSRSNTGVLVALVVIILLLLGGGGAAAWYFISGSDKPEEPVTAAGGEATKMVVGEDPAAAEKAAAMEKLKAEKEAAEKALAEAKAAAAAEDGEGGDDEAEGDDEGGTKVAAATPKARTSRSRRSKPSAPKPAAAAPKPSARAAAKPAARKKEESTSEVDDLLGALDGSGGGSKGGGSRAAPVEAAAPAGDPMLPEKLTKRQILTVVKRNARSITTCKDGTDASGTVPVEMVIGRAGRVTSATVKSGAQKGTPVGSCIERKVRAFRFPQFSGDPMRIVMPFAL